MTPTEGENLTTLDLRGLRCPLPALRTRKALLQAGPLASLVILTDDPLAGVDVPNAVREAECEVIDAAQSEGGWRFVARRKDASAEPA